MKKLIMSVVSLAVSVIMLFTVCFAWFTQNKEATAQGIMASSEDLNINVKLFMHDGIEYSENTAIGSIYPGDIKYFRLDVISSYDSPAEIYCTFDNISSFVSDKLKVDLNQKKVYVDDPVTTRIDLYDLDEANRVVVDDKVLYEYKNDRLVLADYKIESMIKYYRCNDDFTALSGYTPKYLDGDLVVENNYLVSANSTSSIYFALEFDELASSYYSYQKLNIGLMKINKVGGGNE